MLGSSVDTAEFGIHGCGHVVSVFPTRPSEKEKKACFIESSGKAGSQQHIVNVSSIKIIHNMYSSKQIRNK